MAEFYLASSASQYNEKVILEHCRWLFNQDVRIITFFSRIPHPDFGDYITNTKFNAIVLPKTCTLRSLTEPNANDKILIKATHYAPDSDKEPTRESVIEILLQVVQRKTNEILNVDRNGKLRVQRSSLPAAYLNVPQR